MKASLQLKLGQHLTMTPQLQQAIRLLQLSSLELRQEIQEALEANPLLEQTENSEASSSDSDSLTPVNTAQTESSDSNDSADSDNSSMEAGDAINQESVSDELPMDTTWDEMYSAASAPSTPAVSRDDDRVFQGSTSESLQDHLEWQMQLTPFSDMDLAIATAIVDAIDEKGYLTQSVEDIVEAVGDADVEVEEVMAVLKRVQHFDPIGVAARSLQECLQIQLNQFDKSTPSLEAALDLVTNHMELLATRDFRQLMRKAKLKEAELKLALDLIKTLNPNPGSQIQVEEEQYIVPDVSVTKKKGRWVVELNPDSMPKIGVNQQYAALASSARSKSDSQFIKGHLQEARWFIKSLESRNDTLLKVSNCIVKFQQGFFEYGEEAMKPMVLNDIAEAVDMHESTISRVTTQKYMHTPRGIFELKYFFSSHVGTDDGGECSSTAIRALIKKLVAAENPKKPLSDSKMAQLLAEQGIKVARRTIAKYREAMLIPPSNQRKSL
ncbi:RNA polymerase factor sigma-54 [Paraferrimonas sedimenticola]|uniref:RNA polymerase sigma-54 factor n=1 Tax=Paraferrimonas sedimenticola TaxID=375674 RepID=A0AA37VUQ3_9GAMM|nr:RNA polymerase factor sigma-54 [Paraferrimonas sedimenticola]GLP95831.1 RNA polymerase sigma-54 factor [Paraferrimonas sedimenticola]